MNLLHLCDSLSAEASERIGGDSLYVAVLLQVSKQHIGQTHTINNKCREVNSTYSSRNTVDMCNFKVQNIR